MHKYKFESSDSSFFSTLKERVDQYFTQKNIHPSGNWKLYLKSGLQVLSLISLYVILVFFTPVTWVAILLCALMGLNFAVIGFNIMHEGGHQSYSRHQWINKVSAYFLNVLGGSTHYWKIKHNINHHTFTNVEGFDSDIDVKPFMRLHEGQPRHRYHRFQNVYWVILYGVSYLAWIFYEDFVKYFSGRISASADKKGLPLKEHFIFWITKVMYVLVYMVIPVIMVGWLSWLVGFLILTFVCGLAISIVFQLAHVVEVTQFHLGSDGKSREEWSLHQLATTANFATSSKLLHWLLGGLNFQIEHHLFPRISHIHYPEITRLVKETCAEFGVQYNEYSSMAKAVMSHLVHLKRLGAA